MVEYDPDRVTVRTEANRPALLVLADNFYADWSVRIDGQPATMLRANHALRGVLIPAGTHQVVFSFASSGVDTGWTLYLGCMGLLAGYAVYSVIRALRNSRAIAPASHTAG